MVDRHATNLAEQSDIVRGVPTPFGEVSSAAAFALLEADVLSCSSCQRLVAWREQVAHEKRAAFKDQDYWGAPVPGFGDPNARVVIVGLAPGAHGANRTGRMFTGDSSGDWLYRALFRAGYANQPDAIARDDGLELSGAYVTSPVKCVPPANMPTPQERANCRPFFDREIAMLSDARVFVALGHVGYVATAKHFGLSPRPQFAHGVEVAISDDRWILCSYHVSRQNTSTKRLTEAMLDAVFSRARLLAGGASQLRQAQIK